MFAFLLLLLSMVICGPALAGGIGPVAAPELDPGTLAALTSGITAAYFGYRIYRGKTKR
jgi:hypothetical protein